jgi:hypothetical protein
MANTIAVTKTDRGNKQFQGAFKEMFFVNATVSDQDAIADDVSIEVDLTVPGVALGDMIVGISSSIAPADANASVTITGYVAAANTVTLKIINVDDGADAFDADTLNTAVIKIAIGRPNW